MIKTLEFDGKGTVHSVGGGVDEWRFPFKILGEVMQDRVMLIKVSLSDIKDFEAHLHVRVASDFEQHTETWCILLEAGIKYIKETGNLNLSEGQVFKDQSVAI